MSPAARRDEFSDLERILADLRSPDPTSALRTRILAAVRTEMATGRSRPAPASPWAFAAAVAAGILLCVNLSMSAANHAAPFTPAARDGEARTRAEERLRAILPSLDAQEARCRAVLLLAAEDLVPAPMLQPKPLSPEREPWESH
ncbi:MAG: hypothetical protein JXP34_26985 [Planctomycetes bacterium]|nr:hypothetical protein [Planctomycetota bacterium]